MINEQELQERLAELADGEDDASAEPIPAVLAAGRKKLRRRRLMMAGSSVTAAVLVVGVTGYLGSAATKPPGKPPVAHAKTPATTAFKGTPGHQVNLGPMTAAQTEELATACIKRDNPHGAVGRVSHAVKYSFRPGTKYPFQYTVAVQDRKTGLILGCDGLAVKITRAGQRVPGFETQVLGGPPVPNPMGKYAIPEPTADKPVIKLAPNGGQSWIGQLDEVATEYVDWFKVGENVAEVRSRFVINGRPESWFVARPVDGFAYLAMYKETSLKLTDVVKIEVQSLDTSGKLLPAPVMLVDGDNKHGGGGLTTPHGTTLTATGKIVKLPGGDFTGWDLDYKW